MQRDTVAAEERFESRLVHLVRRPGGEQPGEEGDYQRVDEGWSRVMRGAVAVCDAEMEQGDPRLSIKSTVNFRSKVDSHVFEKEANVGHALED